MLVLILLYFGCLFYCICPVALPHCVVGWSAVCACGISYSYLLTFCVRSLFCSAAHIMCVFLQLSSLGEELYL